MAVNHSYCRTKESTQVDSIMATNSSSIVSKRSVERLYTPEPHFFQYFVTKPRRRSPLINRGYWLCMYAVEKVIGDFFNRAEERKVIVNLGCGYDPLAFQWLSKFRYAETAQHATFIDIDYPDLIAKKLEMISRTPQLREVICSPHILTHEEDLVLPSPNYIALGCDLADISKLNQVLKNAIDLQDCSILFISEVSTTYMEVTAANSLIAWAGQFKDAQFCLLEQFLPQGEDYPFARKMIQHFDNLWTPLKSIKKYPTLRDQEQRFRDFSWTSANARSLWDLWNDSSFVSYTQRTYLNGVEPFDEWEEFALFTSHYFLLVATQSTKITKYSNYQKPSLIVPQLQSHETLTFAQSSTREIPLRQHLETRSKPGGQRKFGAIFPISLDIIGHHGGLGPQSRLSSTDVYKSDEALHVKVNLPPDAIRPRMCHTMTPLDGGRCLLVGGRTSPDCALLDCWLYSGTDWKRVSDIPTCLYRHCAAAVPLGTAGQGVLIYGGKSSGGRVMNEWYLWYKSKEWVKVTVLGLQIMPRFGSVMISTAVKHGILLGGMGEDGVIFSEFWEWTIYDLEIDPHIELTLHDYQKDFPTSHLPVICRFGACLVWSQAGLLLVGGISDRLLSHDLGVLLAGPRRLNLIDEVPIEIKPVAVPFSLKGTPPLLIGHSAFACKDSIIILGGGAICFSFGNCWNQSTWTLQVQNGYQMSIWTLNVNQDYTIRSEQQDKHGLEKKLMKIPEENQILETMRKSQVETAEAFEQMLKQSKPFIMEKLNLGPCLEEWTLDYLERKIGADRTVVVHEAITQHLDFRNKNFRYATKPFKEFVREIKGGSKEYLRSLNAEKPAAKPADFASDFPELGPDFKLPPQLKIITQNAHSSPLRISGPVSMWLHYDVMANVLCQIRGSKRLILYPPSDVSHLDIAPGASSSSFNVFDPNAAAKYASLRDAHPQEAILTPGDVLYIPPLWFHAAVPMENLSISINVFFRNLDGGYAAGRDVYGNRDLQAYENGRKDVDRIVKAFTGLPPEISQFYLGRLARELEQQSRIGGAHSGPCAKRYCTE